MTGLSLEDLMMLRDHEEPKKNTILPEAALMELDANFKDFVYEPGVCRFNVGDTVIPKANGLVRRSDELPRRVVAVRPDADYSFDGEPGSAGYGIRSDIRVLCFHNESMIAFWTESSYYELYKG